MSIWHIDQLNTPLGTVDIGLIKDDSNELVSRRGPRLELPSLGENLADTVAHARTATKANSETTDTIPVESILGSCTAPEILSLSPFPRSGPAC